MLAHVAGVAAICYPWGEHDRAEIAPDVTIVLQPAPGKTMTLGQALDEITLQLFPTQEATTQPASRPASTACTGARSAGVRSRSCGRS